MVACYPDEVGRITGPDVDQYGQFLGAEAGMAYFRRYDLDDIVEVAITDLGTEVRSWVCPLASTDPDGPYETVYDYEGAVAPGYVFYVVEVETYDPVTFSWSYDYAIRRLDLSSGTHTTIYTILESAGNSFAGSMTYDHEGSLLYFWVYNSTLARQELHSTSVTGAAAATVLTSAHPDLASVEFDAVTPQFMGGYVWLPWNSNDSDWPNWDTQRGVARFDPATDSFDFYTVAPEHIPPPGGGGFNSGITFTNGEAMGFWYSFQTEVTPGAYNYDEILYTFDVDGVGSLAQWKRNAVVKDYGEPDAYDMVSPGTLIEGALVAPNLTGSGYFEDGGAWQSSVSDGQNDSDGVAWMTARQHLLNWGPCASGFLFGPVVGFVGPSPEAT